MADVWDHFWDGAGGALIGTVVSSIVAIVAVLWTRESERGLLRDEGERAATAEAVATVQRIRRQFDGLLVPQPFGSVGVARSTQRTTAQIVFDSADEWADNIYALMYRVPRGRLESALADVWETVLSVDYPDELKRALAMNDAKAIDLWGRTSSLSLTNFLDEVEQHYRPIRPHSRFSRRRE